MSTFLIIIIIIVVLASVIFIFKKLFRKKEDDLDSSLSSIRSRFDGVCAKLKRMVGC